MLAEMLRLVWERPAHVHKNIQKHDYMNSREKALRSLPLKLKLAFKPKEAPPASLETSYPTIPQDIKVQHVTCCSHLRTVTQQLPGLDYAKYSFDSDPLNLCSHIT